MRRFMLRFVIALVTFAAGVAAATVLGALLGWGSMSESRKAVYVAPPPAVRSCPNALRLELPPPPPPPAPLPPKVTKQTRVSITLPDGSVRVVETKTDAVELKKD